MQLEKITWEVGGRMLETVALALLEQGDRRGVYEKVQISY